MAHCKEHILTGLALSRLGACIARSLLSLDEVERWICTLEKNPPETSPPVAPEELHNQATSIGYDFAYFKRTVDDCLSANSKRGDVLSQRVEQLLLQGKATPVDLFAEIESITEFCNAIRTASRNVQRCT